MSQEKRIKQRLKDTILLKQVNEENAIKAQAIRKKAMRSVALTDDEMKWLVRETISGFAFRDMVFEEWIKDDTKALEGFSMENLKRPAPQTKTDESVATAPDAVSLEDIKEEADGLAEDDLTPHIGGDDRMETVPAPVLEGADKIKAILDGASPA